MADVPTTEEILRMLDVKDAHIKNLNAQISGYKRRIQTLEFKYREAVEGLRRGADEMEEWFSD